MHISTNRGLSWFPAAKPFATELPWIATNLDKGETGVDASASVGVGRRRSPSVPRTPSACVGWGSNWATYTLTPEVMGGKLCY